MNKTIPILIMDDGVTWSGVDCSSSCRHHRALHNELIDGTTQLEDLAPILELGLRDYTLIRPEGNR